MTEQNQALTGDGLRILYVEDDAGLAGLLKIQIQQRSGYIIDIASDGERGLAELQNNHYDFAIVDYNLPVLNGLQLIKILKDNGIDTPVIMLTGEGDEEIASEVMRAGAVDYLVKDIRGGHVDKLCSAIQRVQEEQRIKLKKRKKHFDRRRLAETVFDVIKEGIMVTDVETRIEVVNPAFTDITGYTSAEAVGQFAGFLKSDRRDEQLYKRMWQLLEDNDCWEGELWNRKKSGEVFLAWMVITAIRDSNGDVHRYVGAFSDITERKKDEEEIWHQANFDPLTDLPNRALLVDRASEAMRLAQREHTSMALLFIDLDRFKHINDCYGHAAGDEFLIEVGKRISTALRQSDTVIRLSGDEFIALMPLIHHAEDASRVAEKITSAISQPYVFNGRKAYVSASVGISVYPGDGDSVEQLLAHADMAMYKAKARGRNQHVFFDRKMNEEAERKAIIEQELLQAITENQLAMHFQPVIDLHRNRITHAEALIRWNHPEKGLIMPDDFIPIAEESGLIIPLGGWVIDAVYNQLAEWRGQLNEPLQICLNVSPIQIVHTNLEHQLQAAIDRSEPTDGNVIIEITENVMIEGPERIKEKLDTMKQLGMSFLIDDFGTGFSSMRFLKKMPFDGLKIDRGFVSHVDSDNDKAVLVKAMIEMAHNLNLKVIAEGVERQEELEFLRFHDCDYVQGYLFGRPVSAHEFLELLRKQ
ncbi:cyclic di-GMP phosphodiesterase Gmr [Mariprofundus micogutta]|uniref:Cyclic di-GMP phosphodiesterase Gmr n=1 Tax=Mariprofundus micogutta TaxID=1921010 RepID=A0A1L8CP68_9PROT|nr:GGDEF domain-containing response regulator [Mariprofundus micogutta]GAV20687.1 cyclic di-GMP phosphodiesterase Gmr [Mariprofundus micogutta]